MKLVSGSWFLVVVLFFLFVPATIFDQSTPTETTKDNIQDGDPCCHFPCKNGGICVTSSSSPSSGGSGFSCDCTGLEFHGDFCETPFLLKRIASWIRPTPETVHFLITHYAWLWKIVNNVPSVRRLVLRYIYISRGGSIDSPPRYTSAHGYVTLEAALNRSYYPLALPPVPEHCRRPDLPDADYLVRKLFLRRRFVSDPHGTNLLFLSYAQHFTHQFFKTDPRRGPKFTSGGEGMIDGEEFPPYLDDVAVEGHYPPHFPGRLKFALGHPFYAFLPGLFVFATIWLREHNRVCDLLRTEHSGGTAAWDDERIFQTARLVVVGETIKITIEEYVQHLSQYNLRLRFEPEVTHGAAFQYANRINAEFNLLYHWHALVPDRLHVGGARYRLSDVYFNVSSVFEHGFATYVDAMVKQRAGKLTSRNHSPAVLDVVKYAVLHGRTLRLQPFNKYRERFGLKPVSTFHDLTGDAELSSQLEEMYGSVDALELVVGLLVERSGHSVTPFTMIEVGGPFSVKGLLSNPICAPHFWKPSTFGGEVGFGRVKTASLERLFCDNMATHPCPRISFRT